MLHSLKINGTIPETIKDLYLKPVFYNTEILLNMVNAIYDYSLLSLKKLWLEKKEINVKEFFNDSIEVLKFQADAKKLQIFLKFGENLPQYIKTDPRRLKQILFQLYSNALKFTYKGSITIKIVMSKKFGEALKISVRDTGIGMNEKAMEILSNTFEMTKPLNAKKKILNRTII